MFFLRIRKSLSGNKPVVHIRNVQTEFPLQQKDVKSLNNQLEIMHF